ncbi:anti-anti-sigma factor [Hamadaea flava]|uniref:STAS domain-containing protein n=1 Tax=Hamadaea flava TaxID=1742688 RepID=A0ABV8LQ20_9ACTN|nr:STAS domain-containing protein [Hamadaea flava]MCP2323060.1 anti-anti-sigma factor [Hamadaea flava]
MTPSDFEAWSVTEPGGEVTVFLRGELDLPAGGRARQALLSAITRDGGHLTVDVSQLSFIDAAGVRGLMTAQLAAEAAGQPMRVVGAQGIVATVLRLLHFIDAEDSPLPAQPSAGRRVV